MNKIKFPSYSVLQSSREQRVRAIWDLYYHISNFQKDVDTYDVLHEEMRALVQSVNDLDPSQSTDDAVAALALQISAANTRTGGVKGTVQSVDSITSTNDVGIYYLDDTVNDVNGLCIVSSDSNGNITQHLFSSSTPTYSGGTVTWTDGISYVSRTYSNSSWSQWKGVNADMQEKLVSGTNIKTVNGTSILGSGNIQTPSTTVVNDTTTGGTTAAWSAEQGKLLNQEVAALGLEIEQLQSQIDEINGISRTVTSLNETTFTNQGYYNLDALGFFENSGFLTSAPISLENVTSIEGSMLMFNATICAYVFLNSTQQPISHNPAPAEKSVQAVSLTPSDFPNNAAYIVFTVGTASANTGHLDIDITTEEQGTSGFDRLDNEIASINQNMDLITEVNVSTNNPSETTFPNQGYHNADTLIFIENTGFRTSNPIPLEDVKTISGSMLMFPASTGVSSYVFLDSNQDPISRNTAPTEKSVQTISISCDDFPPNAAYIVFTVGTASANVGYLNITISSVSYSGGIIEEIQGQISELADSKFKNKDVVMFGDSFVHYGIYPAAIKALLGCNIINRGYGGSVITQYSDSSLSVYSLYSRLFGYDGQPTSGNAAPLPSTCDLIIIHAGVNDWGNGRSLGTKSLGTSDPTKIYSALFCILQKLRTDYPTTPIVWGTPCHVVKADSTPDFGFDNDGLFVENKSHSSAPYLSEVVTAIKEVCALFSVPVIDYYSCSGILPEIAGNYNAYTSDPNGDPDGIHPSAAGAAKMAALAKNVLELL